MKKIFALAIVATSFAACNNSETTDTTMTNKDTVVTVDNNSADLATTYTAADGDVMYTDGKTMVYTNGTWVAADKDVTIDNGIIITKDGKVISGDKNVRLADGEVINKTGNFFTRTGNAIEDGWDATKHGINEGIDGAKKGIQKAGEGIEKGANKVSEKTKDVFN